LRSPGMFPCINFAVLAGPNALLINTSPFGSPELTRLNGLLTILQFWLPSLSPKPPPRSPPRAYLDFVVSRCWLSPPKAVKRVISLPNCSGLLSLPRFFVCYSGSDQLCLSVKKFPAAAEGFQPRTVLWESSSGTPECFCSPIAA